MAAKKKKKKKKKAVKRQTVKKKKRAKPLSGIEKRKERRLSPRIPVCARVRWGNPEFQERYFFTRDISASGLFLLTDHPPPLREHINIELAVQYLPQSLQLTGEIVRHESDAGRAVGCGVRFVQLEPEIQGLVREVCGWLE